MSASRGQRRTVGLFVALAVVTTLFFINAGSSGAVQFCNTLPVNGPIIAGIATPYPSPITVSGLTGTVTDVNIILLDVTTTDGGGHHPEDVDIQVSNPAATSVVIMSDAGGDNSASNQLSAADLTLDDQAANQLPADTAITTASWRPVDDDDDPDEAIPTDTWPAAAPAPGAALLSAFNGSSPNGTWNLWMVDDFGGASTSLVGGWCVDILTTTDPTTTTTTTSSSTTTTTAPTTTSSSTTTTMVPTTTSSSTTTTMVPTTTSSSTTTTMVPTTTSSSTTTTTVLQGPTCDGQAAQLVGTSGPDIIFGTPGPDVIVGLGGNDTIYGYGGADIICGGTGDDRIFGGTESDRLFGEAGNDATLGEDGNDFLFGGTEIDRLTGGNGDDAMDGGPQTDLCQGDVGTDSAIGCESQSGIP